MLSPAFLRKNARWLLAGFLMAFASSFGQTFFIGIFAGEIRTAFDLSHGAFGGIYALGTLASAFTLVWLGKTADRARIRPVACLTLVAFAGVLLGMSVIGSAVLLVGVIYGLRLLGQGMISHVAITSMGRWFDRQRGRSVSIAGLGYPTGEAILPAIAVILIAAIGWRSTWAVCAAVVAFVLLPAIWLLLRKEPTSTTEDHAETSEPPVPIPAHQRELAPSSTPPSAMARPILRRQGRRGWTRGEVLRDPIFYVLLLCVEAPSFIVTGIFFNQVHLAETKGWSLEAFAAGFTLFAVLQTVTGLLVGIAIDRFTAVRLLPGYLLPLTGALVVIATLNADWSLFLMMALIGLTAATSATILGALWAELYGTQHLGGIRALTTAAMVVASAASPGLMGWMLDAGITLETQAMWMAAYTVLASITMAALQPQLRSLALSQTPLPDSHSE